MHDQYSPQQEVDDMATAVKIERYPDKVKGSLSFNILESVSVDDDISWESVSVYGRQDAIQSYKTTGQTISLTVAKTFSTAEAFKTVLNNLNKFSRPLYEGGVIARSPLWKITILGGNGYVETPVVIAPNSVSVDYGDRLRKIAAVRGSSVSGLKDPFGEITSFPKRISVTFGGALINTKLAYGLLDGRSSTPGPVADPSDPQTISIVGNITNRNGVKVLTPIRTEGSSDD